MVFQLQQREQLSPLPCVNPPWAHPGGCGPGGHTGPWLGVGGWVLELLTLPLLGNPTLSQSSATP